jgi:hypothetical protein
MGLNAKTAKRLRRIAKTLAASGNYPEVFYEKSTLETERPHTKNYYKDVVRYTKAGIKNYKEKVPMKVGTLKLAEGCQRAVYRELKQAI